MNGKPRDHISPDMEAGWPTLSPTADALALRVARLMSAKERDALWNSLQYRVDRSPAMMQWVSAQDRYLADFDPGIVATIEALLEVKLQRLLRRARARGWEIEE